MKRKVEHKDGKGDGKHHFANAASESSQTPSSSAKPIAASTFFTRHNFDNFSKFVELEEDPRVPQVLTATV